MFTVENENTGMLFAVESDNEKAPDYSGVMNVNGEQFNIAIWSAEYKGGKDGFNIKISEPREDDAPKRRSNSAPKKAEGKLAPKPKPMRR